MSDTEAVTPSLRDALESAFESQPEAPVVADDVTPEAPIETEAAPEKPVASGRDESGRFTKKAVEAPAPKSAETPKAAAKPVVPVTPVAPLQGEVKPATPAAPAAEMKAPQSWRGPAKETWAQLPEAARVEVLRREKEIARELANVGEERKVAQAFRQAVAPYEAMIRAEGSTPERAVGNLLQTAMALRTAPPAHKAQLVASLISDFGVPLDGLVAALQGQPVAHQQQAAPMVDPGTIAQQVEQRLMQQLAAQREQVLLAKATQETDSFLDSKPVHGPDGTDYSDDIRDAMADILERAARRGSTITLERAYSLAAREHPEVSKVLERQERAASAAQAQASTQRARAAAVSVRSSPSTRPVVKGDATDLRGTLEAAFDAYSGR